MINIFLAEQCARAGHTLIVGSDRTVVEPFPPGQYLCSLCGVVVQISDSNVSPPSKRKRGRPRKVKLAPNEISPDPWGIVIDRGEQPPADALRQCCGLVPEPTLKDGKWWSRCPTCDTLRATKE